jgi:hypothetical protein
MVFLCRWQWIKRNMCKKCIRQYFWEHTLATLTLGWWSVPSLFLTPCIVIHNIVRYNVAQFRLRKALSVPASQEAAMTAQTVARTAQFSLHVGAQLVSLDSGRRIELSGRGLAEVSANPNDASILGLKNISDRNWVATLPDGRPREIEVGRSIQLIAGTRLDFGGTTGEIR